ncbi:MAG: HzsA-related protein, partial [Planctomycetota bacterium]
VVSMVSSEGVKRILGTVPIERDGSVCFEAPSGKSLYFQLLDEKHRALQTMRSISGVMPGETRGCLGCHEMHSATPTATSPALALTRPPSQVTPPPWGDESISYTRFVQPVLDKYCGECHQGNGEARETLDLTFRGDGLFKEPYVLLLGNPSWGAAYDPPEDPPPGFGIADTILVEAYDQRDPAAYTTPEPMTKLSYRSRLIEIASSGTHHDVKVDEVSRRRLIAWVDAMGPYRGDEEVREIADPTFQGIDWLSMRPQIKNAPVVVRPGPIENGL